MNLYIKTVKTELLNEFGNKCISCGADYDLEFAHIRPTKLSGKGRGRKERYFDIRKNKTSYILLCHFCHLEYDTNG